MRILGVDPGLTRCGLGVVDAGTGRAVDFVSVEVARSDPDEPVEARLTRIADAFAAAVAEHAVEAVAIERVFAQANVRTVMGVAQVSGAILVESRRAGLPVAMYTPSEVKAAVTGSGTADKAQVGTMVARILRLSAPPTPADAADALAIAIAHAWRGGGAATPSGKVTAAQARWAEAERAARRSR